MAEEDGGQVVKLGGDWQTRLQDHFRDLAERRGAGRHVFALEHGLSESEVEQLRLVLIATANSAQDRKRLWLLWVIHAVEIAYSFSGDEYWQTFAETTPGWVLTNDHRAEIRERFRQFAREYRGPTPTGRWAEWFTIICWPITNALLPTDLQRHMARALFMAGSRLSRSLTDIDELGELVADSGWEGSDRFAQLREQPRLLGQIALALLRPELCQDELILRATSHRIAGDLAQERSAAAWLQSARKWASRPEIHLEGPKTERSRPSVPSLDSQIEGAARLNPVELCLAHEKSGDSWKVLLRLPNLAPIAQVSGEVRTALRNSTCFTPWADRPIARGQLLFDRQSVCLDRWPTAGMPLLNFQGLAHGLEAALLRVWAAPSMPCVFLVRNDGTAQRVESRVV